MRRIKEVLRLTAAGLSQREIAASIGVARSTIKDYQARARRAELSWPLADEADEAQLERRLFPPPPALPSTSRPQPDFALMRNPGTRRQSH